MMPLFIESQKIGFVLIIINENQFNINKPKHN